MPPPEPPPAEARPGAWGWLRGATRPATLEGETRQAAPVAVGVTAPDLEARGHNAARSNAVVSTLLGIYKRRSIRKRRYVELSLFLAFIAAYMLILYYQRDAPSAYQVTSNLVTQFVPSVTAMATVGEVTDWLSALINSVWSDPVCGDGKCEVPFEFPTYGRFGCQADCGVFTSSYNVTGLQVDFFYDFSHPAGSTPATTLLQKTTWNLCPQEDSNVNGPKHDPPLAPVPAGMNCYYNSDNSFNAIAGHDTAVIADMPDGLWEVVINGDLFNKVGGSARNLAALNTAAVALKVQLAQFTVWRANYYELTLLKSMLSTYVNASYTQFAQFVISSSLSAQLAGLSPTSSSYNYSYTQTMANATRDQQLTQFVLTDAGCAAYRPTRVVRRSLLQAPDVAHADAEEEAGGPLEALSFEGAEHRRFLSPGLLRSPLTSDSLLGAAGVVPRARPSAPAPLAFNASELEAPTQAGRAGLRTLLQSGLRASPPPPTPPPPTPYNLAGGCNCVTFNGPLDCYCDGSRLAACAAGLALIQAGQAYAQTQLRTNLTGLDVTAQGLAKAELSTQLQTLLSIDATVAGAVTSAIGTDAAIPTTASLTTLWSSTLADNAAASNAKSFLQARLPTGDSGYVQVVSNMNERVYELSLVAFKNVSVSFDAVNNTYVTWSGGASAYRTCDLQMRGPQYLGKCLAIDPSTSSFLFGGGSTATVTSQTTDLLAICNAVCDCSVAASPTSAVNNCNSLTPLPPYLPASSPYAALVATGTPVQPGYICSCTSCQEVNLNSVKTQVSTAGRRRLMSDSGAKAAAVRLAPDVLGREHPMVTRRRLLTASGSTTTTSIDTLSNLVIDLATGQGSLTSQVGALTDKQAVLQTQAQAYFKDTTLSDLIQSGFSQLSADDAALASQLDSILNVQNAILAQTEAAAAAAAQLNDLAAQQTIALAAVTAAVSQQLSQIQAAVTAGVLAGDAVWALQRAAFIAQMNAEKEAVLMNLPCTLLSYNNKFAIANYNNTIDVTTARYRLVGLTNRVVAGLLLYTQRTETTSCGTRFDNIDSICPSGGLFTSPFGVDPVFKLGTSIYNSALDNPALVTYYYNCSSTVATPTYAEEGETSNAAPYCKELFNAFNLPYGFYARDLPGFTGGYPMFFDINMSYDVAQFWLTYMVEGLLLDSSTTTNLVAVLITYNGELDHFGYSRVEFTFAAGGSIQIAQSTAALRLDLYSTTGDRVRLVAEIALAVMVAVSFLAEMADMWEVYTERGSIGPFFANGWVYVDFMSISLFVVSITLWWIVVLQHTAVFSPALRYDVYYNLQAPANIMRLEPSPYVGANFDSLGEMLLAVETISNLMQTYISLSGVNIILCLLRILKLMDFQPRLGVITHTMFLAASDLGHFFFIFSIIFVAFALTGHLMFGYFASSFSDAGTAINTCFNNLMGDTSWFAQVQQLQGLQLFVGTAYFWFFQICMVLILLNFLLAIICDAFGEVKGSASEATSVIEEVVPMFAEYYRSFVDKNHIPEAQILRQLKIWHGLEPDAADEEDEEEEAEKVVRLEGEQVPRDELIEVVRQCVVETLARTGTRRVAQPWLLSSSDQEKKAKKLATSGSDPKALVQAEDEASEDGEDGFASASSAKGGDGAVKGRLKKQTIVSEEDIVRAADLLLEQVGEEREDEEEEEDFASLTEAMERMIAAQQRLVDGQRLVVEGQQRVATAERRIEDMHRSLNELLSPVAASARMSAPSAPDPLGALRDVMAGFGARVAPSSAASPPPRGRGQIREVGARSQSNDGGRR